MTEKTFKIQIKGRVQGVGFRPFVFNLAQKLHINGIVFNNEDGVIIKMTTTAENAKTLLETLLKNPPPASMIKAHTFQETTPQHFKDFNIVASTINQNINIPLTPDFATCNECKEEIKNMNNRRFGYPFTTCVNCGPRYAITTKFPFERANTSLQTFKMCDCCNLEYTDSNNRRFHSQTNSCSDCGIQLELVKSDGNNVPIDRQNILQKVAQFISEGKIIALKNTNGYLLCCDATNSKSVEKLRLKKKRPNKPFAVLYDTIKSVQNNFQLKAKEIALLTSTVAPIVILKNTKKIAIATSAIAPGLNQTGVMLPSSSLLELLMNIIKTPIICTSGNIHGSPIISENEVAEEKLNGIADYFVHHNLSIQFPQDDSVVKVVENQEIILRRSRGYAPNYLAENSQNPSDILAMGAHLKSTFSLVPNTHIYVSQYFGNLDSFDVSKRYQKTIKQQLNIFNCSPKTVLIDAHPTYQSSRIGKELAEKNKAKLVKIQHHKAHFASVLGEHQLFNSKERILGVVWDGTGYGDDNAIWGGEFFIYEHHKMERINHFEYYDWLANDKMAQEPRIALLSLLDDKNRHYIKDKFSETEWKIYTKMLQNNVLKTSSVGRLFDAVAAALNIKDINTFEAEAALMLENYAFGYTKSYYIDFLQDVEYDVIPSKLIIGSIIEAFKKGFCKKRLAYSFIYTLAKSIIKLSLKYNVKNIACSGGVFQNSLLVSILTQLSKNQKVKLKLNRKLSVNDENISFGQLMYFQNITN